MAHPRILLSAFLSAVLLLASLVGIVSAPKASASATVSTNTINCSSTTPGNIPIGTALAVGDTLTLNFVDCNQYRMSWTNFSSVLGSSPQSVTGNNTQSHSFTSYSGSITANTVLLT